MFLVIMSDAMNMNVSSVSFNINKYSVFYLTGFLTEYSEGSLQIKTINRLKQL